MDRAEAKHIHEERVQATFSLDPTVNITLKSQKYTLEFNNRAVKDVFKDTGVNLISVMGLGLSEMESPDVMGSLLFRGLQKNHTDLTQESVDELFTFQHYPYILHNLRKALKVFAPEIEDLLPYLREATDEPVVDPTLQPTESGSGTGQQEDSLA